MPDLTILIPSRNEIFVSRTVEDILTHSEGDTEIIVVLDGAWADPPIPVSPRVHVIYHSQSIGQRAATNEAARIAQSKYIAKCDAHCTFAQGFDKVLLEDIHEDYTLVPVMRNLHAFDWVCPNGHRRYQGPSGPCEKCGEPTSMDIIWRAKRSPNSRSYCFDSEPHFQYFNDYTKRPEAQVTLSETMSLQGSFFMMSRDKYFELGICDEYFGSWGSMGIEVACKTWLSGGEVRCDNRTWYAHLFRTQGADFSFPYPMPQSQTDHAKEKIRHMFFLNRWPLQKKPLSWLVEKFWPVHGWTQEELDKIKQVPDHPSKGIIYYTDNNIDEQILHACQDQLRMCSNGIPIQSVSLKPIDFGNNIVLPLQRGILTMFKQILAGLEASTADIVFFCEHDVLYNSSHFDFIPPAPDVYYYNTNVWKVRREDGHALYCADTKQTSGLCGYRQLLLGHYQRRVAKILQNQIDILATTGKPARKDGYSRHMGFEPGCHMRPRGVDDYKAESWMSKYPNVDIRHDKNLTPNRWSRELFRDQQYTQNWTEADEIPGWGNTKELMEKINDNTLLCLTDGEKC